MAPKMHWNLGSQNLESREASNLGNLATTTAPASNHAIFRATYLARISNDFCPCLMSTSMNEHAIYASFMLLGVEGRWWWG